MHAARSSPGIPNPAGLKMISRVSAVELQPAVAAGSEPGGLGWTARRLAALLGGAIVTQQGRGAVHLA